MIKHSLTIIIINLLFLLLSITMYKKLWSFKKNVRVLRKVCVFLGIIPQLNYPVLTRWRAIITLLVLSTGSVYSLYLRHKVYKTTFLVTHETLDDIDSMTILSGILITIFNSMILNQKRWFKLEKQFEEVDKYLYIVPTQKYEIYQSFASICVLFALNGYIWIVWTNHFGLVNCLKTYFMHDVSLFYHYILIEFIINLTALLRDKYILLNNSIKTVNQINIKSKIKYIKFLSRKLFKLVRSFNKVFGWVYLFSVTNCMFKLLKNFNDILVLSNMSSDLHFGKELMILTTIEGVCILVKNKD